MVIDMSKLYILAAIAMLVSFAITPLIRKVAVRIGAIDIPKDERRVHKKPMPLIGGMAIYIAFITGIVIKKGPITYSELGIVLGATIITIGGILDDLKDIRPAQKLLFQLSAAACIIIFGIKIELLTNPFSDSIQFFDIGVLSIPISILWIVGVTNAINLIDGLDGLAAGISLISALTITLIAVLTGRAEAAALVCVLSGAILGFLPYNFNPASIFMGDTGSQLLGFLLAAISIEGTIKSAAAFTIAVPILAMGLPIFDTIFAMIRRKVNGRPIMQGDRGHLHHRLLDLGLSQKQAVLIMYLISGLLGGISIIAMEISTINSYFLLTIVIAIIVVICWKIGFFKHRE